MDCVRVTVQAAKPTENELATPAFDVIDSAINEWWKDFFTPSIKILMENLTKFFDEHDKSPFPVVAHVIPPQDESDSYFFVDKRDF